MFRTSSAKRNLAIRATRPHDQSRTVLGALLLSTALLLHGCGGSQPKEPAAPVHTRDNLMAALDMLAANVPAESDNLKESKGEIVDCLMNYSDPKPLTRLHMMQFSSDADVDDGLHVLESPWPYSTNCTTNLVTVIADAVSLTSALLAFTIPPSKLSYDAWVHANPQTAKGILVDVSAFQKADGPKDKSKAFFELAKKVFLSNGFSQLWSAIRKSLTSWWQWVKFCVTMIAQMLLWFGTQSLAFTAQLTFALLSATQLVIDSEVCVESCRQISVALNHSMQVLV